MTALPFRLDGKVALVTGAASGLGRAIAVALADAGARVACIDRSVDANERVAAGIGGIAVALDVTDPAAVEEAVGGLADRVGSMDILVNSAGVGGRGRPPPTPTTCWSGFWPSTCGARS